MPSHSTRLVAVLGVLSLVLSGCNSYRVNQTSLVPAAILTPPVAFKPGFDGSVTGSYTLGRAGRTGSGADSSLWISRGTLLSALEYSGRIVGGRIQLFQGFNAGATRVTRENIGKPAGGVYGIGPSVVFRASGEHPKHRFTFDVGTLFVVAPSKVRADCVDCTQDDLGVDRSGESHDRSVAFMLTGGLQHRILMSDELRVIWGINLQTSVTNTHELDRSIPGRSKVNMGAPHPTLMAGVEWSPTWWATLQPGLAWVAPPSPAIYLPTAMLSVRFNSASDVREQTEPQAGLRVFDEALASFHPSRAKY